MNRTQRLIGALILAFMAMFITIPAAHAAPGEDCGSTCVGLNPADTPCAKDAKTIAAQHVDSGMLELRWSKACNTSWGRYTTYRRAEIFGTLSGFGIVHAQPWTWTDQGSQGTAGTVVASFQGATWWTKMVDHARPEVCTGVRLFSGNGPAPGGGNNDLGWFGNLCVQ